MKKDKCRSCQAPIVWAETAYGKLMPVDAEPSHDGKLFLVPAKDPLDAPGVFSVSWFPGQPGPRFKSHFATCPQAATHRKQ